MLETYTASLQVHIYSIIALMFIIFTVFLSTFFTLHSIKKTMRYTSPIYILLLSFILFSSALLLALQYTGFTFKVILMIITFCFCIFFQIKRHRTYKMLKRKEHQKHIRMLCIYELILINIVYFL